MQSLVGVTLPIFVRGAPLLGKEPCDKFLSIEVSVINFSTVTLQKIFCTFHYTDSHIVAIQLILLSETNKSVHEANIFIHNYIGTTQRYSSHVQG